MTAYVDASVLLRIVGGERGALRQWVTITRPLSSTLVRLECLRTIDRARVRARLADDQVAARRAATLEQLDAFELVDLDSAILERAAEPFPTPIGSLDAVHLATALLLRRELSDLVVATHDRELGLAARAMDFRVVGVP